MVTSTNRGNKTVWIDGKLFYQEDLTPAPPYGNPKPCTKCGAVFPYGGPEAGLGTLPGVTFACCGHGDPKKAYIIFENGITIRGFTIIEKH